MEHYNVYTYNLRYLDEFLHNVPAHADFDKIWRSSEQILNSTDAEKLQLRSQLFRQIRDNDENYQIFFINNGRFFGEGEGVIRILTISREDEPLIKYNRQRIIRRDPNGEPIREMDHRGRLSIVYDYIEPPRNNNGEVLQKGRILRRGESIETDILLDIIYMVPHHAVQVGEEDDGAQVEQENIIYEMGKKQRNKRKRVKKTKKVKKVKVKNNSRNKRNSRK